MELHGLFDLSSFFREYFDDDDIQSDKSKGDCARDEESGLAYYFDAAGVFV